MRICIRLGLLCCPFPLGNPSRQHTQVYIDALQVADALWVAVPKDANKQAKKDQWWDAMQVYTPGQLWVQRNLVTLANWLQAWPSFVVQKPCFLHPYQSLYVPKLCFRQQISVFIFLSTQGIGSQIAQHVPCSITMLLCCRHQAAKKPVCMSCAGLCLTSALSARVSATSPAPSWTSATLGRSSGSCVVVCSGPCTL